MTSDQKATKIDCRMELDYENKKMAENIFGALQPDSIGYVDLKVRDNKLVCKVEKDDPLKLLHTVDDLLMCLTLAEETIEENLK